MALMCPRRSWKIAEPSLSEVHGKSLDENLSDKNIPLSGYGAPEGQTCGWTTSLFFSSTSPDFHNCSAILGLHPGPRSL